MTEAAKRLREENKKLKEENTRLYVENESLRGEVAFYSRRDFDIQKYGSKNNSQTKLRL